MPNIQIPSIIHLGKDHWYIIEYWDYGIKPNHWLVLHPLNKKGKRGLVRFTSSTESLPLSVESVIV